MTVGKEAFYGCSAMNGKVMLAEAPAAGKEEIMGTGVFAGTRITAVEMTYNSTCGIPASAFAELATINEVNLYSAYIGESAFASCTGLEKVHISNVESIEKCAFEGCTAMTSLYVEMLTERWPEDGQGEAEQVRASIGIRAFAGCSKIAEFYISGCDECAEDAFTGVTIPDEYALSTVINEVDGNTYVNRLSMFNPNATVVNIPERVLISDGYDTTSCYGIADRAFTGNNNLTQVTIADGVSSIGEEAFGSCDNLSVVVIPNSVTEIKARAFAGCTSLAAVYVPENCDVAEDAFSEKTTVYTAAASNLSNYSQVTERYTSAENADSPAPHDALEESVMQQTGLINAVIETSKGNAQYDIPQGYYYATVTINQNEDVLKFLDSNESWNACTETNGVDISFLDVQEGMVKVLMVYYEDEATGERHYLITPKMRYVPY